MTRQFWDADNRLHVEESIDGVVWTTVAVHSLGIRPEDIVGGPVPNKATPRETIERKA